MPEEEKRDLAYWVPVVDHTFRILELFSDSRRELPLKELSTRSGVGRTSTFRILFTLTKRGYVVKDPDTGKYRIGPRMRDIASLPFSLGNLPEVARPQLEQLRTDFDETVNLAVLDNRDIVYVQILESRRAFRMSAAVGARAPLHATAIGKAIAAFLPIDALNSTLEGYNWTRFTPSTITDQTKFLRALRRIRKIGYSKDNEESERGASCLGTPILDGNSHAMAGISVSGPSYRIQSNQKAIVHELKRAARDISAALR